MENSFKELGVIPPILQALEEMGFQSPTEVQSKVIPHILDKEDLIVISKTGSGKTAVFGIPILQLTDAEAKGGPQGLILSPTRELAVQVDNELKKFSAHLPHQTLAVYGQHSMNMELQALHKGVSIVTGTPGRVYDHIRNKNLIVKNIQFLVLDEADRMLDMGFIDQVFKIIKTLPKNRITLLFSATIPDEIKAICQGYMKHPVTYEMESHTKTVDTIEQVYYRVKHNEKRTQLHRLLMMERPDSCLIFCNTKIAADKIQSFLNQKGYAAKTLHGDIPQGKRLNIIQQFKKGAFPILIATDIAARGLHIDDLALVINYDVPLEKDNYVHRIGRTGRAGKGGRSVTLATGDDIMSLYAIEEHIGVLIPEAELPSEEKFQACRKEGEEWIKENYQSSSPAASARSTSPEKKKKRRSGAEKPKPQFQERSPDARPSSKPGGEKEQAQRKQTRDDSSEKKQKSRPPRERSENRPYKERPENDRSSRRPPKEDQNLGTSREGLDSLAAHHTPANKPAEASKPDSIPAQFAGTEKKPLLKRILERIKKN